MQHGGVLASAMSAVDVSQFRDQGYTVIENVFKPATEFRALRSGYSALLDREAAEMLQDRRIESYDSGLSFEQRLISICSQCEEFDWTPFDITFTLFGLNAKDSRPIYLGKPIFDILRHPKILDVAEQIIGSEIYCNPVQHVRIKPPQGSQKLTRKNSIILQPQAWHQDLSVLAEDANETDLLTVWVAVSDASEDMGCLKVIPESHRRDDLMPHCPVDRQGPSIPDEYVPQELVTSLPVKAGSIILFHRRTIHGSHTNLSNKLRWSLDLRYQPVGQPTGRDVFPGFIARSRLNPERVLADHAAWQQNWADARDKLIEMGDNSVLAREWSADAPWCA